MTKAHGRKQDFGRMERRRGASWDSHPPCAPLSFLDVVALIPQSCNIKQGFCDVEALVALSATCKAIRNHHKLIMAPGHGSDGTTGSAALLPRVFLSCGLRKWAWK